MTTIGDNAFDNYTSLEAIVLGTNFKTMYPSMLAGVKNLKHVVYYGTRLDFTGANNGDAWKGIDQKQMTLYLGNFDGYKEIISGGKNILLQIGLDILGRKFIIKANLVSKIS